MCNLIKFIKGLFKSKREKLEEKIEKKYNRNADFWDIQRTRNINEALRNESDDFILNYILLYGFIEDEKDEKQTESLNHTSGNSISPTIIGEDRYQGNSEVKINNISSEVSEVIDTNHSNNQSSISKHTSSYSDDSYSSSDCSSYSHSSSSYSSSSSSDSYSSSSCD